MTWRSSYAQVNLEATHLQGWHIKPRDLSESEQQHLISELYPVAKSAFQQEDSSGFYQDVTTHVMQNSDLLVLTDGSRVIAFRLWNILSIPGKTIVYLAGMCVHQDYQGRGIGKAMLHYVVNHIPTWDYMALRTQNPVMVLCLKGVTTHGTLFQYGDTSIPEDVQIVVKIIAQTIGDDHVIPSELVSRRIYGSSLYGAAYKISEKSAGTSFADLDQDAGDAAYCVWRK